MQEALIRKRQLKAGRIMLGWRKICQKIGHRAEGSIDISIEGLGSWDQASGQEEHKLHQRNRSYGGQLTDWAIGRKIG